MNQWLGTKSLYEDGESKRKFALLRQVFRFFKANSPLFVDKKRKNWPKGRVCSRLSRFRIGSKLLLCWLCCWALPVWADSVQLNIQGVEGELLNNVRAYLAIAQLKADEPVSVTRIKRLFKQSEKQARTALQALGYYRPLIETRLTPPKDAQTVWQVLIDIQPQAAIRLQQVEIKLLGDAQHDPAFQTLLQALPLQVGAVTRHDEYELSKKRLRDLAETRGYFDAKWLDHRLQIDLEHYQSRVFLSLDSGLRYHFGSVSFKPPQFSDTFLRHFLTFQSGKAYHNQHLLDFQTRLSGSDYFENVSINTQRRLQKNADNTEALIDIQVALSPKKRRAYRARVGYGTDTGLRIALDMQWRYLNRYGHRLIPNIGWTQNRNRHLADIRYLIPTGDYQTDFFETSLAYQAEDFSSSDISLNDQASGTGVEGRTRVVDLSLSFNKHHLRHWWAFDVAETWTLSFLQESYQLLPLLFSIEEQDFLQQLENSQQENINLAPLRPDYSVLYAGLSWEYARTDDRIYTRHGERLAFSLKGAIKGVASSLSFWQAHLDSHLIRSVHENGRLIFRSALAYTEAETLSVLNDTFQANDLPKVLQFRTGGDRSVRGYSFDAIDGGAQTLVSGKHLVVASLEYEYRFLEQWSVGVFYDAGNVFNHFNTVKLKQGVGLGLRWHSPVGLVRLDVGYAVDKTEDQWRVHVNIGPDF